MKSHKSFNGVLHKKLHLERAAFLRFHLSTWRSGIPVDLRDHLQKKIKNDNSFGVQNFLFIKLLITFKTIWGRSHLLRLVVFHLPDFQAASRTGCCSPGVRLGGNMPPLILTSSSQIFPATIPGVWTLSVRATSWAGRGWWRGGGGWGGGGTGQTRVGTQNLARWCWEATRLLATRRRRRWTSLINIWNRQQTHNGWAYFQCA